MATSSLWQNQERGLQKINWRRAQASIKTLERILGYAARRSPFDQDNRFYYLLVRDRQIPILGCKSGAIEFKSDGSLGFRVVLGSDCQIRATLGKIRAVQFSVDRVHWVSRTAVEQTVLGQKTTIPGQKSIQHQFFQAGAREN